MEAGWYYLHSNGELIHRLDLGNPERILQENESVRTFWFVGDGDDRDQAWSLLVEALAGGASYERVMKLAARWRCNDDDALAYAQRVGCDLERFNEGWFATPAATGRQPVAFGVTALEAMAALCKDMGYVSKRDWRITFRARLAEAKRNAEVRRP